jgi:hypothetical protein
VARGIHRGLTILLLAAGAVCAQTPDAAKLLSGAAEAVRKNRREAAIFVYQERIHEREIHWDGTVSEGGEVGYEVVFVEGETYHKRTSVNGRPLSGRAAREEEQRMQSVAQFRRNTPIEERRRRLAAEERRRLRFDVRLISENHQARFDREEPCGTRRCMVISVWPKPGTRRPRNPNEWSLSLRGHLWIDAESMHPVRAEMEQGYDALTQPEGARSRFKWEPVENVWLIESIVSRVEVGSRRVAVRETVQEYSAYQRFQADSVLIFPDFP